MKTKIEFYPDRLSPRRQGGYVLRTESFDTLTLKAGENVVDFALVEKFKTHASFLEAVKTSAIVVTSGEIEDTIEKNISDFKNVNDAKKAIETADKSTLTTWLDQETKGQNRNTVINALKSALDKSEVAEFQIS